MLDKKALLFSLFIIIAVAARSQTADEIIAKYIAFTGGEQKWKNIKTITSSGTYNYGGVEFPFESWSKAPDLYKYTVTFKGKSFKQAYDGKEGWRIDGFKKETKKTILKGKQAPALANESDVELESPFINYEKKGHKIILEGTDSAGNKLCYKIKLIRKSGDEETYFFSSENYELVKKHTIAKNTELNGSPLDLFYNRYTTIEGITIPSKITCSADGTTVLDITINEIKLNLPVADNIFRK